MCTPLRDRVLRTPPHKCGRCPKDGLMTEVGRAVNSPSIEHLTVGFSSPPNHFVASIGRMNLMGHDFSGPLFPVFAHFSRPTRPPCPRRRDPKNSSRADVFPRDFEESRVSPLPARICRLGPFCRLGDFLETRGHFVDTHTVAQALPSHVKPCRSKTGQDRGLG
jgi:hypothetical protein